MVGFVVAAVVSGNDDDAVTWQIDVTEDEWQRALRNGAEAYEYESSFEREMLFFHFINCLQL